MKKSLILLLTVVLFYGSVYAKYYPATIFKHDGTQVECLAEIPQKCNAKKIKIKDSDISSIESIDIKLARFSIEEDKIIEFEYLPVISWSNMAKGNQKVSKPEWMAVLTRGPVTLYFFEITSSVSTGGRSSVSFTETYYYCKRESEEVASTMTVETNGSMIRIGNPFIKIISKYFADSPGIVEKISNKEKGYKSKDIVAIVNEYNAEKLAQ